MKAANKDPYDIKKFEEVLGESYMMVPDSSTRLKQALQDLNAYVHSSEVSIGEYESNEWYIQANELLDRERNRFEVMDDIIQETSMEDLKAGEAF